MLSCNVNWSQALRVPRRRVIFSPQTPPPTPPASPWNSPPGPSTQPPSPSLSSDAGPSTQPPSPSSSDTPSTMSSPSFDAFFDDSQYISFDTQRSIHQSPEDSMTPPLPPLSEDFFSIPDGGSGTVTGTEESESVEQASGAASVESEPSESSESSQFINIGVPEDAMRETPDRPVSESERRREAIRLREQSERNRLAAEAMRIADEMERREEERREQARLEREAQQIREQEEIREREIREQEERARLEEERFAREQEEERLREQAEQARVREQQRQAAEDGLRRQREQREQAEALLRAQQQQQPQQPQDVSLGPPDLNFKPNDLALFRHYFPSDGREFTIERKLGSGTYGSVFEATKAGDPRRLVLKIMKISRYDSFDFEGLYALSLGRRMRARRAQGETHIMPVLGGGYFERGVFAGQIFIVYPLMNEGSLYDLFEKKDELKNRTDYPLWSWAAPSRREVMLQLLEGLVTMHSFGYAHNDMKPLNILVHREGDGDQSRYLLRLADFGLGCVDHKILRHLELPCIAIGTPYYLSPEYRRYYIADARPQLTEYVRRTRFARENPNLDRGDPARPRQDERNTFAYADQDIAAAQASDVFSLGLVLFEAFYQRAHHDIYPPPPFIDEYNLENGRTRRIMYLQSLNTLEPDLQIRMTLIGMLAQDPRDRFTAEQALRSMQQ